MVNMKPSFSLSFHTLDYNYILGDDHTLDHNCTLDNNFSYLPLATGERSKSPVTSTGVAMGRTKPLVT